MGKDNLKHGLRGSPEYITWQAMRQRCLRESSPAFQRYGGRGIKIDPRWNSFENFLADMGNRPSQQHSLDRKDNNLGYGPDNCRWATRVEQARNRRDNVVVELHGKLMKLPEACEALGYPLETIRKRLLAGWSVAAALGPWAPGKRGSRA